MLSDMVWRVLFDCQIRWTKLHPVHRWWIDALLIIRLNIEVLMEFDKLHRWAVDSLVVPIWANLEWSLIIQLPTCSSCMKAVDITCHDSTTRSLLFSFEFDIAVPKFWSRSYNDDFYFGVLQLSSTVALVWGGTAPTAVAICSDVGNVRLELNRDHHSTRSSWVTDRVHAVIESDDATCK